MGVKSPLHFSQDGKSALLEFIVNVSIYAIVSLFYTGIECVKALRVTVHSRRERSDFLLDYAAKVSLTTALVTQRSANMILKRMKRARGYRQQPFYRIKHQTSLSP